jgi:hypothetical protein
MGTSGSGTGNLALLDPESEEYLLHQNLLQDLLERFNALRIQLGLGFANITRQECLFP